MEKINYNAQVQIIFIETYKKKKPGKKVWTIKFLLESPKNKEFQPPDLEINFLFDSGAESKFINIPTWNEIKTLHPILIPMKTASKLATAQGSIMEKSKFCLSPLEQWNKTKF